MRQMSTAVEPKVKSKPAFEQPLSSSACPNPKPPSNYRRPQSSESADRSLVAVILQVKCHSIDLLDGNGVRTQEVCTGVQLFC